MGKVYDKKLIRQKRLFPFVRVVVCLYLIGFVLTGLIAQNDSYSVRHFTDESGLPQNSIKDIVKDSLDYYWMVTENGIVRFDGQNFIKFGSGRTGTGSDRYFGFQKKMNHLTAHYAITEDYQYVNLLDDVRVDKKISKKGFDKYYSTFVDSSKYNNFFYAKGLPRIIKAHSSKSVYVIQTDYLNTFYLCFHDKIKYYKDGELSFTLPMDQLDFAGLFLLQDKLYYKAGKQFWKIEAGAIKPVILKGDVTLHDMEGPDIQIVWNINSHKNLIVCKGKLYSFFYDENGDLITKYIVNLDTYNFSIIESYYFSEEGDYILLGSLTNGLLLLSSFQFKTLNVPAISYKSNVFYAQTQFNTNSIMTPDGYKFTNNSSGNWDYTQVQEIDNNDYGIFCDSNNFIWVSNNTELLKLDSNFNRVESWDLGNEIVNFFSFDDELWFSCRTKGLYSIHLYKPNTQPQKVNSLKGISCFLKTSVSIMWLGSKNGLYRVDLKDNTIDSVPELSGVYCRSLHYSDSGQIWISTYENGFFLYEGDSLFKFPLDKEEYLRSTHCIYEDVEGYFWMTTNKGLFRILKHDLINYVKQEQEHIYYHYYDRRVGFGTNEFNGGCQPCALELDNGLVSLPSLDGLVVFDPLEIKEITPSGILKIDKFTVDNVAQVISDTIVFPRDFEEFAIELSTPYLGNEEDLYIYYSLQPKSEAPKWRLYNTEIRFSRLDHGEYQFRFRKLNGFGKDNFSERSILLIKPPYFYQTWTFYLLIICMVIVIVYLYIRVSLHRVRVRNRLLEIKVNERTITLKAALDSLKKSKNSLKRQLQTQEYLLGAMNHDVVTPLKYVLLNTGKISKNGHSFSPEIVSEVAEGIHISIKEVYELMSELLEFSKIQIKKDKIDITTFNLSDLIHRTIRMFDLSAKGRDVQIISHIDDDVEVESNEALLQIVISNLVDNSVKNTLSGSTIRIRNSFKSDVFTLSIEDEGGGIPQEIINWLETGFQENDTYLRQYKGLGLFIVKELLEIINSKIEVTKTKKGNRISILFLGEEKPNSVFRIHKSD